MIRSSETIPKPTKQAKLSSLKAKHSLTQQTTRHQHPPPSPPKPSYVASQAKATLKAPKLEVNNRGACKRVHHIVNIGGSYEFDANVFRKASLASPDKR